MGGGEVVRYGKLVCCLLRSVQAVLEKNRTSAVNGKPAVSMMYIIYDTI